MNVLDWQQYYLQSTDPRPFGESPAYAMCADFLKGFDVEDWGCGYGWFKTLHDGGYRGVDGVHTGHEDIVADLSEYLSNTPAIFMRGVIEYNSNWKDILHNCMDSANNRIALVVTTSESSWLVLETVGEQSTEDFWNEITLMLKNDGWSGRFTIINNHELQYREAVWLAEKIEDE
jgi:hypothetical protein